MSLRDQGFKFCISPDKKQGRWLHPSEFKQLHSNWTDVTEWPSEKLVAFLMPMPKQQDLFAA
ncbi:hypothetical protein [Pseudomonas saponiphila]|uniref:hypothetical protein n=1 Tax=Pseudomonas saponiphila TaxID=556534 RepID=UPI00224020E8|nr:hypothetical protein [Pseudomonas saponiphila]